MCGKVTKTKPDEPSVDLKVSNLFPECSVSSMEIAVLDIKSARLS